MSEPIADRFQNLHEFVTEARINLDRNNWDYLIGGSETETTLARNRLALDAIGFRPWVRSTNRRSGRRGSWWRGICMARSRTSTCRARRIR